jgi:hypothetical protein
VVVPFFVTVWGAEPLAGVDRRPAVWRLVGRMAAWSRAWISDVGRGASDMGRGGSDAGLCAASAWLVTAEGVVVTAADRSGIVPEADEPGKPTAAGRSESDT